jgi:chromosome segregation ATPase
VAGLEEELAECHLEIETAELRERELAKTREELDTLRLEKDKLSVELRNSVSNTRMSGIVSSRIGGLGGEEKKRIRELEQLLDSKHIDLSIERKKMQNEFERERRALLNENNELREEVSNLQSEFDFQRSQLNKEIESLSEDCERLSNKLLEKDDLLAGQEKLLEGLKNESNAEQIQEYIANMKAIFDRMEISKGHEHFAA